MRGNRSPPLVIPLKQIRPEAAPPGQAALSKEEQAPAIAAAVERLAEDKDVDLLALAKNPQGLDPAELEAKLMAREKELEEGRRFGERFAEMTQSVHTTRTNRRTNQRR